MVHIWVCFRSLLTCLCRYLIAALDGPQTDQSEVWSVYNGTTLLWLRETSGRIVTFVHRSILNQNAVS